MSNLGPMASLINQPGSVFFRTSKFLRFLFLISVFFTFSNSSEIFGSNFHLFLVFQKPTYMAGDHMTFVYSNIVSQQINSITRKVKEQQWKIIYRWNRNWFPGTYGLYKLIERFIKKIANTICCDTMLP